MGIKFYDSNGKYWGEYDENGEPFDEYDPPGCDNCDGGDSYEECQRCCDGHTKECVYDSRRDYEIDKALDEMERSER